MLRPLKKCQKCSDQLPLHAQQRPQPALSENFIRSENRWKLAKLLQCQDAIYVCMYVCMYMYFCMRMACKYFCPVLTFFCWPLNPPFLINSSSISIYVQCTDIYMDVPFAFAINNFVPLCTVLYVCIYIHIYIYIYIYVYMYMYVYMYACMYVCTYVRTYVCMYACVYTCIYVCMYPYAYIFMYVYTHMYVCISILQERLPLARMVYVSATGVSEPKHFMYMWQNFRAMLEAALLAVCVQTHLSGARMCWPPQHAVKGNVLAYTWFSPWCRARGSVSNLPAFQVPP
jgi:hypothetical protein